MKNMLSELPPELSNNPLLNFGRGIPFYSTIKPEHISPAINFLLQQAEDAVRKAADINTAATWTELVEPLENATELLGRSWGTISHLNSVVDTPELREAYGVMIPKVTAFFSSLSQNIELYKKFISLQKNPEYSSLSNAHRKVIENSLRDFRLGGAELDNGNKPRFSKIQDEQAMLAKAFSDNVLDATDGFIHLVENELDLAGIPDDAKAAAANNATQKNLIGWAFSLHFPSYFPVMQYADNRKLRRLMYEAYITRASELAPKYGHGLPNWDNTENMLQQLRLRDEEAKMLGFPNYADLSIASKMASTIKEVDQFLIDIAERAKPFAQLDWKELQEFATNNLNFGSSQDDSLQPWDIPYVSEKLKQERFAFSENEVKQYFPLAKVLEGLFRVIQTLFSVQIKPADLPTWHSDVQSFSVNNLQNEILAYFYLDPYARSGKRGGAWMDDARGRRQLPNGDIQIPIAYLVCNFPPPLSIEGKFREPTISHDDVITLFHESGHGLHHLLTKVNALGVSGINGVEWDAVELPSQFMENFCWEWEVLESMTSHVENGKPIPRELFNKMLKAKNFQNGLGTLRQVVLSLTDWRLHSQFNANTAYGQAVLHLAREISNEFNVIPQPEISRWPNTFSHIFSGGYAAGYYSYKWAEVLSADAYSAFEEASIQAGTVLDIHMGEKFRMEILEVGGSRPAAESFKAFRGRKPKIDALLKHGGLL